MVQVVGALAQALGQPWKEHAERLLEPMALTGLCQELVDSFCLVRCPIEIYSSSMCWVSSRGVRCPAGALPGPRALARPEGRGCIG